MLLADARLPIGGHTQSAGLEPALLGRAAAARTSPAFLRARGCARSIAGRGGDRRRRAARAAWPASTYADVERGVGRPHPERGAARRLARPRAAATAASPSGCGRGRRDRRARPAPTRDARRGRSSLGAIAAVAGLDARDRSAASPYDDVPAGRRRAAQARARSTRSTATGWCSTPAPASTTVVAAVAAPDRPDDDPRARCAPLLEAWAEPTPPRTGGSSVPDTTRRDPPAPSASASPAPSAPASARSSRRCAARSATSCGSASSPTTSTPTRTPGSCAPPGCSTPSASAPSRPAPARTPRSATTSPPTCSPSRTSRRDFAPLDVVLVESGGDNLTATFSPALVDAQIFVLDVAGGGDVARKGGPGIARADLLVVNKTDLAPYVGVDVDDGAEGRAPATAARCSPCPARPRVGRRAARVGARHARAPPQRHHVPRPGPDGPALPRR